MNFEVAPIFVKEQETRRQFKALSLYNRSQGEGYQAVRPQSDDKCKIRMMHELHPAGTPAGECDCTKSLTGILSPALCAPTPAMYVPNHHHFLLRIWQIWQLLFDFLNLLNLLDFSGSWCAARGTSTAHSWRTPTALTPSPTKSSLHHLPQDPH